MTTQLDLLDEPAAKVRVKSPLCIRMKHCGSKAELGEPQDLGGCINTELRCVTCGATGVSSERKGA